VSFSVCKGTNKRAKKKGKQKFFFFPPKGIFLFPEENFSFPTLKLVFQSLKLKYQSLELMFPTLKRKISLEGKTFSPRGKKKCLGEEGKFPGFDAWRQVLKAQ